MTLLMSVLRVRVPQPLETRFSSSESPGLFGTDIGHFIARKRISRPSAPTEEEWAVFRKRVERWLAIDPAVHASHKAVSLDL